MRIRKISLEWEVLIATFLPRLPGEMEPGYQDGNGQDRRLVYKVVVTHGEGDKVSKVGDKKQECVHIG